MPRDPEWLTQARAEGRVTETRVAATLPGIEAAEPGAVFEKLLPWGPSVNPYWRYFVLNGTVRHAMSTIGKDYRKAVVAAIGKVKPLTGPLCLHAVLYPPTRAILDIDNRMKPLLDALQAAEVFVDDSQVKELHARFGPVRPGGAVAVKIEPLAEATDWGRIRVERDKLRTLALALLDRCGVQSDILTAIADRPQRNLTQRILDVLREAEAPVSLPDLIALTDSGLSNARARVYTCLTRELRGLVKMAGRVEVEQEAPGKGNGSPVTTWTLADGVEQK